MEPRPPLPPFTREDAVTKVRAADNGLMARRHASINDVAIDESDRLFRWPLDGPRPGDHPGLTDLDL
ncbi:MAG: DUF1348 family protein [Nocardioides sp.]